MKLIFLIKNRDTIVQIYSKYMLIIGVLGHLLFYFQAYTIFTTKCSSNVSFQGFAIALFSVTSWLIYGFLKKDKVLILSNIVAVVGALLVLTGILIHK